MPHRCEAHHQNDVGHVSASQNVKDVHISTFNDKLARPALHEVLHISNL
ncbi:MAG: hypothetical protein FWG20_01260 [Candidatus Cloacimonetes bacterium]|nr:hypothetical protein [Candidatus Cloacimonadota bacterium]